MVSSKKKLIEVALPLEAINKASAREKSIRHGHPSTMHLWWARRPLAAARAVIFAQMVDDPSSCPDLFPTEKAQEKERQRLFRILEDLVLWENTNNEKVLQAARDEIWSSWRRACAENADHPQAKELFDRNKLPGFHDPFAGGGALPLEGQRLGLESHASDLNPVAVLINKAMIEIPSKFSGRTPVNPDDQKTISLRMWKNAEGLASDVRHYGKWMRDEAEKKIGYLYPKIKLTIDMTYERPNLRPFVGEELPVVAWIWARTVKSPNPAFSTVDVPLASTFLLCTKEGRETFIEPVIDGSNYRFTLKSGKPQHLERVKNGTKLARGANFQCIMSGSPITSDYIKAEGKAARLGARLMAIVAESKLGRIYFAPTKEHEEAALHAKSDWKPEVTISGTTQYLGVKPYGMERFDQLFTDRQLLTLTTITDLIHDVRKLILHDAIVFGMSDDNKSISDNGIGAKAYAEAVCMYLAFAVSKALDRNTTLCTWEHRMDRMGHTFTRQALPMTWDYVETNPLAGAGGDVYGTVHSLCEVLDKLPATSSGFANQADAATQLVSLGKTISTDPPYYDNVPYADLSDFFYVWLRQSLKDTFPALFATVAVPKAEELVAFAYRHDDKAGAEAFFLTGMTQAMHRLAEQAHPAFPVTIYYAFKQTQSDDDEGTASTGWETFLAAVISAGFATSGTWPMRTELSSRMRGMGSNALASSIVLVCRKRSAAAPTITRREFISTLKAELPVALANLQRGNIAPVDLAQAAIGPGMAVYTRFEKVLDVSGNPLSVREALTLINQILDETLAEQEGDFDADTRWALAWFEHSGFAEGDYGLAEILSKAKNTSVAALALDGFLASKAGKVRLFRPVELAADWDPTKDTRLTVWEMVHHLIRVLETGGEPAAAELVAKLGSRAEIARELAYRLYSLCERKKRAPEAMAYNGLVQSWPEITRLSREEAKPKTAQTALFSDEEA